MYIGMAYEDDLSEAVLDVIVESVAPRLEVCQRLSHGGSGYLKGIAPRLNQASQGMPYVLLTDLDRARCPPELLAEWVPGVRNPRFVFRVAVREVEAWLLAHREALAAFLGVQVTKLPSDPESLLDPKQFLVSLARLSRIPRIRRDLAPEPGSTARVGPGYSLLLTQFVRKSWRVDVAKTRSTSLRKTVARIAALARAESRAAEGD